MATNGPQALKIAHTWRPDLMLLDVEVPGMDGHDVCRRRLARTLRETPRRPGQPTAARAYITAPSCQGTNSFCP
jgi:CheY-like chemotaxis protein